MKRATYFAGRGLQLGALMLMPSAIWAGSMDHNEKNCILLFLACIALFYTGYFLTRWGMRLQ